MSTARIAVIGTGYVGLTSAACFAAMGHEVVCADVDAAKVAELSRGQVPILEAGLDELVAEGIANGRLTFVTDNLAAVRGARFVFLCLPTPEGGDGRADLRIVHQVVAELAAQLDPGTVLVTKSTVPVGTAESLTRTIARGDVAIVSNPEFLQEGTAVRNFMQPDRVVVGSADAQAARDVADLYESLNAPAIVTSAESAELIKYASNSFLAVKLSFVNSVAALAAEVGADITDIAAGMGLDPRIGDKFLRAGPGWGGSCFPKDVKALAVIAEDAAVPFPLLTTAVDTNDAVQRRVVALIAAAAGGSLQGVTVGLWG
jgi:UDPglucose 6-dehydrogenase